MDIDGIRQLMQQLCSTDIDFDLDGLQQLHRACAIIEDITAAQCKSVISSAGDRPCIQMFQSDGWSCDMRSRFRAGTGDVAVQRTGRLRSEFVVQRSIVKALVGTEMLMAMKIERPRPLLTKKCIDVWSAATDHAPMLKLAGHRGISISLYIQDGLFSKPFGKMMRARHILFFDPTHCPLPFTSDAQRQLAELRDWVLSWTCCAHSCSRALKLGLASLVPQPELLEDVHVSISSLIRASTGLYMSVPQFVATFVSYDRPEPSSIADVEHFWSSLDVEPKYLELFVAVNPLWIGGKLHVSSSLLTRSDAIEAVTTIIHYCLKWVDFSDTRWTKVGQCSRLYIRSLAIGVDEIVKIAERNDAICKWHLNGYNRRCSASVRRYLAVAAIAGRPSESLIIELFEDDRFLMHCDRYWEILADEHQYILAIPHYFHQTIADLIGSDPLSYRSDAVEASIISIGYLYMELWLPMESPPWCYFLGDVHETVAKMMDGGPVPTDDVGVKMHTLAMLGYEAEVEASCLLIRESSMTSIIVEQCHASGAQIMHRHPQLEQESLCCRMTVHNSRTLFHPSQLDKQEGRLTALLEELNKQMRNTEHTGPRQAYLQLLVTQCKATQVPGDPSQHAMRRAVFKIHGEHYKMLTTDQVQALKTRASHHKKARMDELMESKLHVQSQLAVVSLRRAQAKNLGLVNHIDSCRFGPHEFARFAELWQEYQKSDTHGRLKPAPCPIPGPLLSLLHSEMDKLVVDKPPVPDWLSAVVGNRDDFRGVAIHSDSAHPDALVVYKLVVAMQQPRKAIFLECHLCRPLRIPDLLSLSPGVMPVSTSYGNYSYTGFKFVDHFHVPFTSKADMLIHPQAAYRQVNVHTFGWPEPFEVFTRYHRPPLASAPQSQSHRRSRLPIDAEILRLLHLEFPWMTLEELQNMLTTKARVQEGGGHVQSSSAAGSGVVPEVLPEDVLAGVAAQLAALKDDAADFDTVDSNFRVRVLGGDWSITLHQQVATGIGAYPKGKEVVQWCQKVGWPPGGAKNGVRSFAVLLYGLDGARHLAEEMCRLGDYYMKSWMSAGCPTPFDFGPFRHGYVTAPEYGAWFDAQSLASAASKVAFEIQEFVPKPIPP